MPLSERYTEDTSEWTLDYPPFFAWFEYTMAKIAAFLNIDPDMLLVKNLNHKSLQTVLFQRISVIATDLVLAFGAFLCYRALNLKLQTIDITKVVPLLVLTNAGLFMVDHIHFQYNGFLLGILLASIGTMMTQQYLIASWLFAILLNLKHI